MQKHFPQCKLVRAVRGSVFDVAVDLRRDSKTYGKWYGVELTEENKKQFLIPEGFAHGFLTLSGVARVWYRCTDFYYPEDEAAIVYNDTNLAIDWPDVGLLTVSEKDRLAQTFFAWRQSENF